MDRKKQNRVSNIFGICLISTIIMVIVGLSECAKNRQEKPSTSDTTVLNEIKVDTILQNSDSTYKPNVFAKIETEYIHDTIVLHVDTAQILADYFAKYVYVDTLTDSSYTAIITDTISENKIQNRKFHIDTKKIVITNTNTITITQPQRPGVYVGGFATTNGQNAGVGGCVTYIKNSSAYTAGYDFVNKSIQINYSHKFFNL